MKLLKLAIASFGFSALLAAGGCGGADPVKFMQKYTDEMCACKDKKCAEEVQKKMAEEAKKMAGDKASAPSADDQKKMEEIMKKMAECTSKAMTAG